MSDIFNIFFYSASPNPSSKLDDSEKSSSSSASLEENDDNQSTQSQNLIVHDYSGSLQHQQEFDETLDYNQNYSSEFIYENNFD
jgi:hypothetical protein